LNQEEQILDRDWWHLETSTKTKGTSFHYCRPTSIPLLMLRTLMTVILHPMTRIKQEYL